jgi:hypothetical protein
MLKKALLSTLLTVSTIAIADINLNLDVTITNEATQENYRGNIVVEENVPTSIALDDANTLIINIVATQENEDIVIQTQVFKKIDNCDDFEMISEPAIKVAPNQTRTITLNNIDNGSLTLSITPTVTE